MRARTGRNAESVDRSTRLAEPSSGSVSAILSAILTRNRAPAQYPQRDSKAFPSRSESGLTLRLGQVEGGRGRSKEGPGLTRQHSLELLQRREQRRHVIHLRVLESPARHAAGISARRDRARPARSSAHSEQCAAALAGGAAQVREAAHPATHTGSRSMSAGRQNRVHTPHTMGRRHRPRPWMRPRLPPLGRRSSDPPGRPAPPRPPAHSSRRPLVAGVEWGAVSGATRQNEAATSRPWQPSGAC